MRPQHRGLVIVASFGVEESREAVRSTAIEDRRHCCIDSHRTVLPASYTSLLLRAGTSVALAVPLLVSGPGWMRVAAATLTGGSLVAVALIYAVRTARAR